MAHHAQGGRLGEGSFQGMIGLLLGLAITWVFINGVVHTAKEHSGRAAAVAVVVPPVLLYRAVEAFTHDATPTEVRNAHSQPAVLNPSEQQIATTAFSNFDYGRLAPTDIDALVGMMAGYKRRVGAEAAEQEIQRMIRLFSLWYDYRREFRLSLQESLNRRSPYISERLGDLHEAIVLSGFSGSLVAADSAQLIGAALGETWYDEMGKARPPTTEHGLAQLDEIVAAMGEQIGIVLPRLTALTSEGQSEAGSSR